MGGRWLVLGLIALRCGSAPPPVGLPGADTRACIRADMGVCIRADTRVCPYEDDDAMNVIGHDDERIGLHARIKRRQFVPNIVHHPSCIVQPYFAPHHPSKQAGTVLGANGNKIRPWLVEGDFLRAIFPSLFPACFLSPVLQQLFHRQSNIFGYLP